MSDTPIEITIADAPILGMVSRDDIEFGERFREDYGNLQELVASFKKRGIIQPLAICRNREGADKSYRLAAGGRRFKACELAGIDLVPCRIYDRELTELELREIELAENLFRKDLGWLEKGRLCKQIHELQQAIYGKKTSTGQDAKGWSQRDTADLLGKSPTFVTQAIQLADAIEIFPEIGKCRTEDEARKMFVSLQEKLLIDELAKRKQDEIKETPIGRIRGDLVDRYALGDFFEGVKYVPDNSIDVIEVDPPYGIDLQARKKVQSGPITDQNLLAYNEVDQDQLPYFINNTLVQCYRVLKPTGWIILWFAHEPWFEIIFQRLKANNFEGNRMVGVWKKQTGQSKRPELYLANTTEMFFYARKSNGIIQRARGNCFDYPSVTPSRKRHPTERPIEMIMDVLRCFGLPGMTVMVPFLGSGNTILAASNLGMTAFGWDLSKEYKDSYTLAVHNGEPGFYTSYPLQTGEQDGKNQLD